MKKLIWVLGFFWAFAGVAFAGTADGLTPAEETVCDEAGLSGAAWGLCNTYCEAMDCDSDTPKASVEACSKIAEQFAEKTSGDTPPASRLQHRAPMATKSSTMSITVSMTSTRTSLTLIIMASATCATAHAGHSSLCTKEYY